ncbi:hypothetical protein E2562_002135 [Oryza meyeriana var. granulata]|uniref:Uncharacterized protein n=1 Tax=Oryza meyeriana var. granulata TaxID=110450 RepID=A0A6G1EDQ9_9ORYZ|nr:hypothetical protein E2562_002135 [Oryza meyeriana var. granulata]
MGSGSSKGASPSSSSASGGEEARKGSSSPKIGQQVLDEIHQQSAALSSRPSFSSIGSVPAPKEVVERLPTYHDMPSC